MLLFKGRIKPKANEFVLFLLFTANKTNLFVRFLGESTARQSCIWFYLTFRRSEPSKTWFPKCVIRPEYLAFQVMKTNMSLKGVGGIEILIRDKFNPWIISLVLYIRNRHENHSFVEWCSFKLISDHFQFFYHQTIQVNSKRVLR